MYAQIKWSVELIDFERRYALIADFGPGVADWAVASVGKEKFDKLDEANQRIVLWSMVQDIMLALGEIPQ